MEWWSDELLVLIVLVLVLVLVLEFPAGNTRGRGRGRERWRTSHFALRTSHRPSSYANLGACFAISPRSYCSLDPVLSPQPFGRPMLRLRCGRCWLPGVVATIMKIRKPF